MKKAYNTLIIGSGCAGYHAAERLFKLGVTDIAIMTEGRLMGTSRNTGSDKQTYYKLSLAGDDGDSVRELAKTLYEGGGVRGDIALVEAAYSTRCFMHLVELGVPFPKNEYGEYAGYKTDHDPRRRATSTGPLTSKYMTEALEGEVMRLGIEILDGYRAVRLITREGEIRGVAAYSAERGEWLSVGAKNVILATGGPAGIYECSVYPKSQSGALGLAAEAGCELVNLEQWQYGIASTDFRWNLSGTYQQVIPRYVSLDGEGNFREFLYDALGSEAYDAIFLKGYQWPFDTRKRHGSSRVDLLVAHEIKAGRRVFLDFTKNPIGLKDDLSNLGKEAHDYLESSGVLFGTPIDRLLKMNRGAYELYLNNGIDLKCELLEIAVCAQHCNGGVAIDSDWQTSIKGLFAAGEAAGSFGVYRPGGSALNSCQVGSLRCAEYIAKERRGEGEATDGSDKYLNIRYGEGLAAQLLTKIRHGMSLASDFERSIPKMKEQLSLVRELLSDFEARVTVKDDDEIPSYLMLYDALNAQAAVLDAMIFSAEEIGTHGSAYIVGDEREPSEARRDTQTLTDKTGSRLIPTTPIPDAELWFETLLARQAH